MHSRIRALVFATVAVVLAIPATSSAQNDLWRVYNQTLSKARY